MVSLHITRGLPGSGKTRLARAWVAEDESSRVRVNRDDIRCMFHGRHLGTREQEDAVSAAQHTAIAALLAAGYDVICDDTNLNDQVVAMLRGIAVDAGAVFHVHELTDVHLEVCLRRDARRTGNAQVGAAVIRGMHARYLAGRALPLPIPEPPPTFFERRAAADPSVDHESHSTGWAGGCLECPGNGPAAGDDC